MSNKESDITICILCSFQKLRGKFKIHFINLSWFNVEKTITLLIKHQSCHHIETSQLICPVNQLVGFYMIAALVFNELTTLITIQ